MGQRAASARMDETDVRPHSEAQEAQLCRTKRSNDLDLRGGDAYFFLRLSQGSGEERRICLVYSSAWEAHFAGMRPQLASYLEQDARRVVHVAEGDEDGCVLFCLVGPGGVVLLSECVSDSC